MELAGKTAIVTGASGGIGQAVAEALARAGADVAICGQNQERLAATSTLVAATGRRVLSYAMNVAQADAVQQTVDDVAKQWGRIDIMVNNAGITKDGLLIRMSESDWDDVINVNLKSVFLFSKAVARVMMKQRTGSIVNIASIIGLIGNPGQGNYSASKGGIIAFTKSVARELASRHVRANAIAPGFIETRMTEKIPEDLQKKMLDSIPLGRYGKPEDVANLAVFLAGDRSAYITGQVISICGGMVMQ
ncbi:MAG TPA: 3-oxoacyl-[acyl-carrier-protein] reductase [Kiritimatiellia bacterium]|nr:3-oxoacyl-[acyl-carrier-protein] reductase [Kiritimatiellia bacterium]HMP34551.1 3-oxoacyl-[acyl-carrier-protein] reductase [Kiritimatiellia bacterium]